MTKTVDDHRVRCSICGRFCSPKNSDSFFIPDNEFGPERTEWECPKCWSKSSLRKKLMALPVYKRQYLGNYRIMEHNIRKNTKKNGVL